MPEEMNERAASALLDTFDRHVKHQLLNTVSDLYLSKKHPKTLLLEGNFECGLFLSLFNLTYNTVFRDVVRRSKKDPGPGGALQGRNPNGNEGAFLVIRK